KGISGIGWRHELLEIDQIIEMQMVGEQHRFDTNAVAKLNKAWLPGESGSGRFGVESFAGRASVIEYSASISIESVAVHYQLLMQCDATDRDLNMTDCVDL